MDFKLVKKKKKNEICGSHSLKVLVEDEIEKFNIEPKKGDFFILPGGLKGTENLLSNKVLLEVLEKASKNSSIGAICAAPLILGKLSILKGKKACCYPGFEKFLEGAEILEKDVVVDGNIITSKGAGTAQQFSFEIIKYLKGEERANQIKGQVQWGD